MRWMQRLRVRCHRGRRMNAPLSTAARKRVIVIGGGISGLTAAWRLHNARPDLEILLLERGPCVGGVAQTWDVDGYSVDLGPGTCAPGAERISALVHDLGLDAAKVEASSWAKRRYVFSDGQLQKVPTGFRAWLESPLMSLRARLRVFLEPFSRHAADGADESVFSFAARRFGDGVAHALVEPLVSGIVAGSAQAISIQALAPTLYKMDREHRSLVWAMASKGFKNGAQKKAKKTQKPKHPPRPWRLSGGIGQICAALGHALTHQDVIRLNAEVQTILPGHTRRWSVTWQQHTDRVCALRENTHTDEADAVIVASPAHVSSTLLQSLDPAIAHELAAIPYAGVYVTALGYRVGDVPEPLDGFGFLSQRNEPVRSLGCLWTSSMFPNTAPPGHVLLRVISGGSTDPEFLDLTDSEALDVVRHDLRVSLGIKASPSMVLQRRIRQAIPQYTLGHCARLARLQSRLSTHPGLLLTSSAYQGLSLDDCVRQAEMAATMASAVL
jgi:oxygen-dependent protoporphyrinogen oxidase